MGTTTPSSQPSLDSFFEAAHAFHSTAALKAAVELDVFTAIGEGKDTTAELAARVKASERGVRILCDFLTVMHFLEKSGDRYALTLDSKTFLDRHSPSYVGGTLQFLLSPEQFEEFRDLAGVVRKGGTLNETDGVVARDHPVWVNFARAMAPLMHLPAQLLSGLVAGSGKCKVLDIAAGHGLYGIGVAKSNPQSEIVALDWAKVLEVAKENARAAGVADRYSTIIGSAMEVEYGKDYDLILLTNILHHFDPPVIQKILRKCAAALKQGGQTAILEFVPNEDRVSPPIPARFSIMMLASTPAGDAYTLSEFKRMLNAAGFSKIELHHMPPTFFSTIIATK